MADLFYHSSVYGDLIALDKFLIRFQHIDICFFGKRFFKTTVITASHPRLQAYEGSTGYGPDTEIREALTGKCQIWSSVREEDTGLLDLAVIKNKSVFIKHVRSNGTGSVFKESVCGSSARTVPTDVSIRR